MSKKADIELTEVRIESDQSKNVDKTRRVSADQGQSNAPVKPILRHTQSQRAARRKQPSPSITPIPETNEDEQSKSASTLTLNVSNLTRKLSTFSNNTGITTKGTVRESGRSINSIQSQVSTGTRGSDGDVLSYQSQYSSNQSLSTYKEQYCCSPNSRFTPRERKLCASVGVLATIIVILVTVVGYLADNNNGDEPSFFWKL